MTRSNDLVTFLFEFYNYVKLVKDDRTLDDKKSEIAKLVEDIDAQKLSSLYSRASKNKKRSRRGEGHGDTNDGKDAPVQLRRYPSSGRMFGCDRFAHILSSFQTSCNGDW